MNRKKIAFIISAPITAKAFLVKHFEYLSKEFEITVIANFENKQETAMPFVSNVKHIAIQRNINVIKDLKALFLLYSYLRKNKFDATHSVTPKAGLISAIASWMSRIPIRIHIFTGQVWYTSKGFKRFFLKLLDKIIVFFNTHILVDGESQRQFLINENIITLKKSKVLGKGSISGVDTDRFFPSNEIREKYRQDFNFLNEDIIFAFLGRLNTDKGILDLANAFYKLNKDCSNVKLLLIGYDEENMLEKIKGIQRENIVFFGPTAKPEEVLQAADVFCLPSYREGFGTSVIEASLLELPVICSNTYGLAETIVEGETGLRHEVKNVNQLYTQMKVLVENEEMRKNLGKKGRQYVLKNFSAEQISNEWVKFYKVIISNV